MATAVAWPVYIWNTSEELRCESRKCTLGAGFAMTDAGDELLTPARPVYVQHVCLRYCLWFPGGWLTVAVGMCEFVLVFEAGGEMRGAAGSVAIWEVERNDTPGTD